jgi:hypothetical protein
LISVLQSENRVEPILQRLSQRRCCRADGIVLRSNTRYGEARRGSEKSERHVVPVLVNETGDALSM